MDSSKPEAFSQNKPSQVLKYVPEKLHSKRVGKIEKLHSK
jgi:hypothetical protein